MVGYEQARVTVDSPIQKIFLWMTEKQRKPRAGFFQLVRGLGFQVVKEEDILQAGVGVYSFKGSTKVQTLISTSPRPFGYLKFHFTQSEVADRTSSSSNSARNFWSLLARLMVEDILISPGTTSMTRHSGM